jgi:aryl-alcohol dehydrogenase-like predicted oxidoreductase
MGLVCEQSLYNLKDRMIELEVIPACRDYGLGLIPWSPLAGGLLGGALAKEAAKKNLPQTTEADNLRKHVIEKIEAAVGTALNKNQLAQARVIVQGVYEGVLKEEKIVLSVAERQRLFEVIIDEMLGMDARREAEHTQKEFEKRRPQLEKYENLCRELGEKPADVALAWLLHNPVVTAPIIGPRTIEQFTGSLRAVEIKLSPEVLKNLDEIFPGPGGEAPEAYAW